MFSSFTNRIPAFQIIFIYNIYILQNITKPFKNINLKNYLCFTLSMVFFKLYLLLDINKIKLVI